MEFLEPIEISLLTERRARQPYGLAGGENGASGLNLHVRYPKKRHPQTSTQSDAAAKAEQDKQAPPTKRVKNVGGKATIAFEMNDRLIINTPGGGGWGVPGGKHEVEEKVEQMVWEPRGSLAERGKAEAEF